jgi:ABC-2 type transport system ATP-binding protein
MIIRGFSVIVDNFKYAMLYDMNDFIITAKNVTKKFGDFTAVDNVSFQIKKGEIFAFLGPNGAGKSTMIKMLTTLLHPTAGEITLNGFDVVHHPNKVRRSFGIIFQDPSLDTELTAYENMLIHAVMYGMEKSVYVERIQTLMKLVELWDKKDQLVKNYSGGMKRRLEIARGLLHHPAVLFLDEPTVGLDPQTRNLMWNYLRDLGKSEKITVFFTTHYLEEAEKYAERLAVIDHGKIVAHGTTADLEKQTGKTTLEDAFLALTGKAIREEEGAGGMGHMARVWGRR